MKPLVLDLFCGLSGWGEAFAKEGFRVVGFDIENQFANFGKQMPNNCELVLRDVRSLNGADLVKEFGAPECIVASPPCQFFSYVAMPWSKAKALGEKVATDPAERAKATDLFNQCFRIQREVSEAAGRYVPIVIENVRGAQRWVGKARWNFGSFYLWGDVPALMPIPIRKVLKAGVTHRSDGSTNFHQWKCDGNKTVGQVTRVAGKQAMGNNSARRLDEREVKRLCDANEGRKNFTPNGEPLEKNTLGRRYGSKSKKRKQVSAEIAKIPPALAHWIARCFTPKSAVLK